MFCTHCLPGALTMCYCFTVFANSPVLPAWLLSIAQSSAIQSSASATPAPPLPSYAQGSGFMPPQGAADDEAAVLRKQAHGHQV